MTDDLAAMTAVYEDLSVFAPFGSQMRLSNRRYEPGRIGDGYDGPRWAWLTGATPERPTGHRQPT